MSPNSSDHQYSFENGRNGYNSNGHFSSLNHNSSNSIDEEIDLVKLFSALLRNKWILIAFVLGFSLIATFLSFRQIPVYNSEGTIFISESKNRYSYAGSDLSNLLTTTYGIGVGSTIANELQILKSRTLSEVLADSLLEVQFSESGKKFPLLWRDYPVDSSTTNRDTLARRIRETLSAEQVDRETDIVRISFESHLPEEAAFIVNLTMDTYSTLSTDQNRAMATSALSFLKGEKANIDQLLAETENKFQEFMESSDLISVDAQTDQLINTISTLESNKQEFQVQLVAVKSAIEAYKDQLDKIKPGLSDFYSESHGSIIERYQYALAEAETEKLLLLAKNPQLNANSDYPELMKLDNEIQRIKTEIKSIADQLVNSNSDLALNFLGNNSNTIAQNIIQINQSLLSLNVQESQYETQIKVLDGRIASLNRQFESLPEDMIELARLKRDVSINEQLFMLVSNQYAEMSLWEKTQFGLGRPLDYAIVPSDPIKPDKKLWVIFGFVIGGIVGLCFIFVKETMDDKIKSSNTLKTFNIPFLGNIPDFTIIDQYNPNGVNHVNGKKVSNQLVTFLDHISPISEAYRRLRINVVYANPDKKYKVLMVTSATKGEGKSTVAANLAVTFSEAERNVLIIDLDLRRPTQHKIFGEAKEPGVTDSLFETISIKEIVKSTISPNVDLLTVGKKTPEPATILDSKRLKELIDRLSDKYDHIILDTAPYGIISDSASLLRLVDGLILVSRFNFTTNKELSFTIDGLRHLNADIVGIVFNAFDPKRSTDYYTNYSYYKRTYSEYYGEKQNA